MTPLDAPDSLQTDQALQALHTLAGSMGDPHAHLIRARLQHLEDEAAGLAQVCDSQHEVLMRRDLEEARRG